MSWNHLLKSPLLNKTRPFPWGAKKRVAFIGGPLPRPHRTWSSVRLAQIQCPTPPLRQLQHPPIFMARQTWEWHWSLNGSQICSYQTWMRKVWVINFEGFPESNSDIVRGWELNDLRVARVGKKRSSFPLILHFVPRDCNF